MSFALLRPGVLSSFAKSISFVQPRCALKLKSKGVEYYWLDHPYETLHQRPSVFDRPQYRLNDNSRSICVEGNIAVGKGTLARNLADVLYLKYVPNVSDDDFFIDKNYEPPLDYRDYNTVLPKHYRFYTTKDLYTDKDPIHHGKPLYVQQNYFMYRCYNYWKSCAHLFSTGQGFVMNRSPFSTFVFAKAMHESGLMSEDAKEWFMYYDHTVISALMYPHLVVYLRTPVKLSRANLNKRALPWEKGISDKFLEVMKQVYESEFLPKVARYSEILTIDAEEYNFSDANDVNYIAEEMCKFDLDQKHLYTDIDTKLIHWRMATLNHDTKYFHRMHYTSAEYIVRRLFGTQVPDDMTEGGLTLQQSTEVRDRLKLDPRQEEWSTLRPHNLKSAIDVMLGRVKASPVKTTYCYDEDTLKRMAYYRNFGYCSRSIAPKYNSK